MNREGCGARSVTGPGGELTSIGYPELYPPDVECVWTIKVSYDRTIVINFLELDLGDNG